MLCAIYFLSTAQNVDRGLLFAQSLKARIEDTVKQTNTAKRRIKKLSSTLDNKKAASVDSELIKIHKAL